MRIASLLSLVLLASTLTAGTSSVKLGGKTALAHVAATRFVQSDGTSRMFLLFTAKPAKDVVLVDAFGNEGFSLGQWTAAGNAKAVKVSFVEGDEENYSLNVHEGQDVVAAGGHRSGDGTKGVFKKIEIKGDRVRGTLAYDGHPATLTGNFDTTFTTVKQPPAVTGAAVVSSPQGKALLAYAAAMRKLDFVAATKYSVRDEAAETKKMPASARKELKEIMLLEFGKTAAEFEKRLATSSTMSVEGDKTKIRVKRIDGDVTETSTFGLENVNGVWKVNY